MTKKTSKHQLNNIFKENEELVEALGHRPHVELIYSELIRQMGDLVEAKKFAVGESVLVQGKKNDQIMFLKSGSLKVLVDGNKIAELSAPESMIGEISSITGELCSASIEVGEDAVLQCISIDSFADRKADGVDLENLLLRLCSKVLSDKLRLTNDQAKQFVVINQELVEIQSELQDAHDNLERRIEERTHDLNQKTRELEEQNEALSTTQTQLLDESAIREATLNRLVDLRNTQVKKMRDDLVQLDRGNAKAKEVALKDLTQGVETVTGVLDSLDTFFESSKSLNSARILLAEDEPKQRALAKASLVGTGVSVDVAGSVEAGLELLENHDYDVVCVNQTLIEIADVAHKKNDNTEFVFMTSDSVNNYFDTLDKYPFLTCIVARNDNDRSFTIKSIQTTVSKLVNQDLFGIEKYINWGVEIKSKTVVGSIERWGLVDQLGMDLEALGLRSRLVQKCKMVAEELLTNAIYDAPKDSEGKSVYNYQSREKPVALREHEYGRLRYAYDGIVVAISVEDPFGGFPRSTILKYLKSCFEGNPGSVDEKKGGGGMGLFQIMQNSNLVIYNVKKGVKTEVIALLVAEPRSRTRFAGQSFQYFYQL